MLDEQGRRKSSSYAARDGGRFLSVTDIDTGHPALRSVERFNGVEFLQAIRVTPSKSHVLARLNDQTPLVLERQIGEGKVLVFASTFDYLGNDLPKHAAWVPFIQQSTAYLGGGGAEQPVNLIVDSYVELRSGAQQRFRGGSARAGWKATAVIRRSSQGEEFSRVCERRLFRNEDGQRPPQLLIAVHADRRESGFDADSAGDPRPVEGDRRRVTHPRVVRLVWRIKTFGNHGGSGRICCCYCY